MDKLREDEEISNHSVEKSVTSERKGVHNKG